MFEIKIKSSGINVTLWMLDLMFSGHVFTMFQPIIFQHINTSSFDSHFTMAVLCKKISETFHAMQKTRVSKLDFWILSQVPTLYIGFSLRLFERVTWNHIQYMLLLYWRSIVFLRAFSCSTTFMGCVYSNYWRVPFSFKAFLKTNLKSYFQSCFN